MIVIGLCALIIFILILSLVNYLVNKNSCCICGHFVKKDLRGFDISSTTTETPYRITEQKWEKCDVAICVMCLRSLKKLRDIQ